MIKLEAQRVVRESDFQMFPEGEPLVMSAEFAFLRPKSVSVKKRPHHIIKPDLDNIAKNVKDALSGVAYADDRQITEYVPPFRKRYARDDEQPFVRILIMHKEDWLEESK